MDSRPIWKPSDDFGIEDSEFIGWRTGPDRQVRCADALVIVSVWRRRAVFEVASGRYEFTSMQLVHAV
jgi:hypothetical protein